MALEQTIEIVTPKKRGGKLLPVSDLFRVQTWCILAMFVKWKRGKDNAWSLKREKMMTKTLKALLSQIVYYSIVIIIFSFGK